MKSLCSAALVAACLASVTTPTLAAEPAPRPNVIMILMDDLGWKDLGCTGSTFYETPHIDALASRGVLFTRSYAAAPICSPTRASVLTGLSPARIGITLPVGHEKVELLEARVQKRAYTKDEAKQAEEQPVRGGPEHQRALQVASATRLSMKHPSIAKVFKAHGYRTGHFGKWHLGPEPYSALDHGFDVDVPHINTAGPPRPGHFGPWPDWAGESGQENKGRQVDECLADHAIEFIRESKGQPFYMNFWPYGVHIPFQAQPELVKHFEGKADPDAGQRNPLYAAMIKHTDDAIGKLWAAVEEAGLAERTVVVFLSDNGGVTAGGGKPPGPKGSRITDNAPLRGEKGDVYEGGVRVPGFIVWPGVGAPGTTSALTFVSTDVLPTVAEMCGLHDVPKVDGRSVAPAVAGRSMDDRPFFMHYPHYGNWVNGGHPAVTMVADGWKLIRFFFDGPGQKHRYELYHLDEDPGESTDRSREEADRVAEMDRQIDAFLHDTGAVLPQPNPEYRAEGARLPAQPPAKMFRLEGSIDGLDSREIELRYELGSDLHREKVPVDNGRFSAVLPVDRLTLVRGWLNVARVVKSLPDESYIPSLSSELCFLASPDATVRVKGEVRGDFVNAYPAGDAANEALATLHRQLYPLMSRLAAIQLAEQLGDDTGAAADDDPDLINDRMQKIRLDFLHKHPESPTAAWLLSDMLLREQVRPRKAATILATLTCGPAGEPFLSSIARKLAAVERTRIGRALGEFTSTRTLDGSAFDLQSLRGKHVVIDFWGGWCGPCCEEIPRLKEYAAKYPDTLRFVSIAKDTSPDEIKEFAMPWPQIMSGDGDDDYVERFGVDAFPTKLLIDPDGRILARHVGATDGLFKQLDTLLGGPVAGGQPAAAVADELHEDCEAITADESRQLLKRLATGGQLYLDAVETLPADVAAVLAEHDGYLSLAALEELSAVAAAALANGKATGQAARYLDGLKTISDEAIVALLRQPYQHLSLGGLKKLSPAALEAIAGSSGSLALGGVRTLSVDEARALARHTGTLYLPGLKAISDDVAAALASHEGGLGLNGLVNLSDAAAASLATSDGYLSLGRVQRLSDDVTAILARHKGFLLLAGVEQLSDPAAEALAKHEGDVSLTGLQKLSPAALKSLQGRDGVYLPPLDSLEVTPLP